MTIDAILDEVLKAEGGFVDHPADKGQATNFGITLSTLSAWRKKECSAEDVKALTEAEARDIYQEQYFKAPGFNQLHSVLWPIVVDAAVNHGVSGAIKMLQRAVRVKDDGVLGLETLTAANLHPPKTLAARFLAQRARKFGRIVTKDPTQAVFAEGWMNRLAKQMEENLT